MTVERGTRGTVSTLCSGCGKEPRRLGQRYGLKCHAKAEKEYRARRAERERAIRWRLHELGAKAS